MPQYLAAKENKENGYTGYQPVFVAWFDHKINQEAKSFISTDS